MFSPSFAKIWELAPFFVLIWPGITDMYIYAKINNYMYGIAHAYYVTKWRLGKVNIYRGNALEKMEPIYV